MVNECSNNSQVLPEAGKRNILITSALPFVNNVPHLGNIIGSVLSADAFARYCRGRGLNTLYIGGTDEYGTTTEARALVEQCTPQDLCEYRKIHADIYKWFNISFDIFGRTTTQLQTDIIQDIFLELQQSGFLQERMTTQLYCEHHHSFLADRFVEGECPICGYIDARGDQCDLRGQLLEALQLKTPRYKLDNYSPVTKDTKHMFLELDKLQPEVERFFNDSTSTGAWTSNSKIITSSWLKQGLQPRSITRDIKWGTAVPLEGYEDKVIYSWFDACTGYFSITAAYTKDWEKWWRNPDDVELFQFIGKDNVVFHSVIFPSSQLGTKDKWTKLSFLSTTDYLTYEGGKFSKSRGIGVFGDSAQKTGVPADDCQFVHSRHYNGVMPDWTASQDESFDSFKTEIDTLLAQYNEDFGAVKLRSSLAIVLQISQQGNAFLQSQRLNNALAELNLQKCAAVVGMAVHLVHLLASLVLPFMPDTANSMISQLRVDLLPIPDTWEMGSIEPGHQIGVPDSLFSRIRPEQADEWRKMFGSDDVEKLKREESLLKAKKITAAKIKKNPQEGKLEGDAAKLVDKLARTQL